MSVREINGVELSKLNLKKLLGFNGQIRFVDNIKSRKIKVGVVGVGYVGKALAQALLSSGFETYGFDINPDKLGEINHQKFTRAYNVEQLENCDIVCICVPTPLDGKRQPDLRLLIKACNELAALKTKKQLVIVESTVAPGTLRNIVSPIFAKEGKKLGEDFYLAISPERVDPGNKVFTLKTTPKVVGGIDEESAKLATEFYSTFIDEVVTTTTSEVAELSKLLENTFRLVNISLVNEIKGYADKAGIDIWEVINAAATKPFAFMPHYPGPGVGGHCIPVDPVYLLEEAKSKGVDLNITRSAIELNETMSKKIVGEAKRALNGYTNGRKPKLLLIGLAYKPNSSDTRESPALKIWKQAASEGFKVSYYDPHVPKLNGYTCQPITKEILAKQDVIVIVTHHENIPYELLDEAGKPIIDTRNIMRKFSKDKFVWLERRVS